MAAAVKFELAKGLIKMGVGNHSGKVTKAALCSFTALTAYCCCSLLWYNSTESNMPQH